MAWRLKFALVALSHGGLTGELQLDHDPPLAARERKGEGRDTIYFPDANDPDYLFYRQRESHDVKTRIRGDHGQYSDIVLAKRERRRRKRERAVQPEATDEAWKRWQKSKRKLRSANRWPPKGSQKFPRRVK